MLSPSGKYKLMKNESIVVNVKNNKTIANLPPSHYGYYPSFFYKEGHEFLQIGFAYLGQMFIDLDMGQIYDHRTEGKEETVCWTRSALSEDGNTLYVEGCVWSAPYEIEFYDFTNPKNPPNMLEMEECISIGYSDVEEEGRWEGNTLVFERYSYYSPSHKKFIFEIERDLEAEIKNDEEKVYNEIDEIEKKSEKRVLKRWSFVREGDKMICKEMYEYNLGSKIKDFYV